MSGDHNRYASVNINDHDTPESMLAAIRAARSELQQKQATCQHRWEQTFFGEKYWQPGTYQYQCARCGKTGMITLEINK